jgi:hypothetical protein
MGQIGSRAVKSTRSTGNARVAGTLLIRREEVSIMRTATAAVLACVLAGSVGVRSEAAGPLTPKPVGSSATWHEVTIPAGTAIPVVFETSVGSDLSRVEQPIRAHVARGVTIHGLTAVPRGSVVSGVVTSVRRPGRVKGRGQIAVRFTTLERSSDRSERYRMQTRTISRIAPATKKADALKIGVPAAAGAVVGGVVGGKKGALIGSTAGGGAGTAVVLSTRGREVRLLRGTTTIVRLSQPLTVRVRG